MQPANVVVVGAGAAGLAFAVRCKEQAPHVNVRLIEPPSDDARRSPNRTWCFWESGAGEWDDLLEASWDTVRVRDADGTSLVLDLDPLRYKMLSSKRWLAAMAERAQAAGVESIEAAVVAALDGHSQAQVVAVDGQGHSVDLVADLVVDTRPVEPAAPGKVQLLQHFRGWFVRTPEDAFDPRVPDLMDFRTRQPRRGVSFGYVLPTSPRTALVEYTEFTQATLRDDQYDVLLRRYLEDLYGVHDYVVDVVEDGVIPMTDGEFPRVVGPHVVRIGAAGGATRPSTGYTFAAAQRQAKALAASVATGTGIEPPSAYGPRHLAMDALMLRALSRGHVGGAEFFMALFRDQPADRVFRFLDGTTTAREDLAIMRAAPIKGMMRALADRS